MRTDYVCFQDLLKVTLVFYHEKEVTNLSISLLLPLLILKNMGWQLEVAANNTIIQSHAFKCDRFIDVFFFKDSLTSSHPNTHSTHKDRCVPKSLKGLTSRTKTC